MKSKKRGRPKKKTYVRPSWDNYFMEVANAISKRATCDRGRAGTVVAKDNQLLVTGYVGSPSGFPHCHKEPFLPHVQKSGLLPEP